MPKSRIEAKLQRNPGESTIAACFRRCTADLPGMSGDDQRGLAAALARLETSRSAAPLQALARRIAALRGPEVASAPERVVFLKCLADALPGEGVLARASALALAALRAPRAEEALLDVGQRFGPDGHVTLALGRLRLGQGQARQAVADFEQALSHGADQAQALFGEGLAWLALEEPQRAAAAFARARATAPDDGMLAFHLALALARAGDTGAALRELDALLAREPRHAKAWFERGNLLQDAGRHGEAEQAFAQALAADPSWAAAAFNRAVLLQATRRLDDALRSFGLALALDPAMAGPIAQALTREPAGCLWLTPRDMAAALSARSSRA